MTNYISITIQRARDGGLSIHETGEDNVATHVFSGDSKQITDYFSKRVTELADGKREPVTAPVGTITRASGLSPRALADRIHAVDLDEPA